jgi:N-acetylmuramoyl-L-alanine amidase
MPRAQEAAALRYTLKTIDSDAGVRVILEFSRKPVYEVRRDGSKVLITLHEQVVDPPFKKQDHDGTILERIKFIEGFRSSEIVFYTGDDFGTFASFEMGEPFRIVFDFRRRQAPPGAERVPAPAPFVPGVPAPGVPPGKAVPGGAEAPDSEPGGGDAATPKGFRVVIDPGHGGDEDGARGPSGLLEKEVTLDVARRLKNRVQAGMEAEVIMTRENDRTVPLDERTAIANHNRADLFVSIHANSSRRGTAAGSETYFLSYQATDDESRAIAAIENNTLGLDRGVQGNSSLEMVLWDLAQSAFLKESSALAETIQERLDDALGQTNRGIKQAPFRVLMGATMPAVLIEIAFISNPDEERRLRDPAFKDRLAGAIFDSIRRFHDKYARAQAR